MKKISNKKKAVASAALAFGLIIPQAIPAITHVEAADNDVVKLRIMETSDVHTNLISYDYYKGSASDKFGLAKTYQLVKQARAEQKNNVLIDNGDTIQGTPLATFMAKIDPLQANQVHPVIKMMNAMGYDMANLGNHEFNYGLDFLNETYNDAKFGFVNANVYVDDKDNNPDNDVNNFTPYEIVEKIVVDENGAEQKVKIGYLGLVPPQIMDWDRQNLDGKVIAKDMVETAKKFVPKMKAEGADVVIIMAHSGYDPNAEGSDLPENAIVPLSKIPDVDVVTMAHTHKIFPADSEKALDPLFKDKDGNVQPDVNNAKGTINGVASIQSGFGGERLGVIDLTLTKDANGKWQVTDSLSSTRAIYDAVAKKPLVDADQELVDLVKEDTDATVEYTMGKLGTTTAPIHSYFGLVQDDPSVQVVTNAQKWYVEKYIKANLPEYKDTPILSVGAPFKAGRNGVDEYTEIEKGDLTIRSAGDLYLYDNTLKAILVKGSVVKEWMEMSAGKFNQINPRSSKEQALLNPAFAVYNFDIIDGVTFQIDVTKPAKYKTDGTINNALSSRVVNIQFNGKPLDMNQDFIVVTNNYRASGGGNFPGVKGSKYIIDSPDENRAILMDYITETGEVNPTVDNNWSIAPIKGNPNVTFISNPIADKYAKLTDNISYTGKTDQNNFGIFKMELGDGTATTVPTPEFTDVTENHWAKTFINSLADLGLVNGKSETTFAPSEKLTRGQFVAMVVRALGLSDGTQGLDKEVAIAYEYGITTLSPDKFEGDKEITREQMAAMVVRAYGKKKGKDYTATTTATFKDADKVGKVFKDVVNAANELGFMTGNEDGNFTPLNTATRAQAAKVIYNFLNK
ncbi:bifunctional 2',3'-cyclic-nucleotide 2'-phosphodiesterase/3'-nucleotidase [Neobacillus sp. D3-1R]|uniref:bifunctional 2',3'-cyclic-nucleotide 2'-phosphodiesterase/3'-nucleotidase n=1 Tax=Neobacillus sp. D3-1R TaxID=3445778 RepID=UPI003FA16514